MQYTIYNPRLQNGSGGFCDFPLGSLLAGAVAGTCTFALSLAFSGTFALGTIGGPGAIAVGAFALAAGAVAQALLFAGTLSLTRAAAIAQTLLNLFLRAFAFTGSLTFARKSGGDHSTGEQRHHHVFLKRIHSILHSWIVLRAPSGVFPKLTALVLRGYTAARTKVTFSF